MNKPVTIEKPFAVTQAEIALWAWTVWTCVYGIYDTKRQIPEIQDALAPLEGMVDLPFDALMHYAIIGYIVIGIISAFFVIKLNQGKEWSRSSFLWGFIIQGLITLAPPYHSSLGEYLGDIPDLGLQIYAVTLLYNEQSSKWFEFMNPED